MKLVLSFRHWVGVILLVATMIGAYWILSWRNYVYTDDAYVEGNLVKVTPLENGFITAIHTDDSFYVAKGSLLIELDATDAKIQLSLAKDKLAKTVREVSQSFHQAFALAAHVEENKALFIKAEQDFKRRYAVIGAKGVSLENYQHALDDLRASYARLKRVKHQYQEAMAFIQGVSISQHPWVQQAVQELRMAWVNHYRTKIYAPVSGLIATRRAQVGMWVTPKQELMSIIPLTQVWVNANFKETQMKRMRIGQKVAVTSDLYGSDVVFDGKIVGLPGAAGNAFSLLPPQNLSGNWIKIVQRLPVRIELEPEKLQKYPLRVGLSMEVVANIGNDKGQLVADKKNKAPQYSTDIFKIEERGDALLAKTIINANIPPDLNKYANTAITMKAIPIGKAPAV